MKKKNILITGGSGFIGTHLARALAQEGHRVTVLDLKEPLQAVSDVVYVRGDVRETRDITPLIPGQDAIYHFAAIVSVPDCQADPAGSYRTNTFSTLEILKLIHEQNKRRSDPARIIFSSSSAVYGDHGKPAQISEDIPLPTPCSFYGAQKLSSEQMIRLYASGMKVPAVIFRFFNVFGLGQKSDSPYSGVISLFVRRILAGEVLLLNGGGAQTRDFISVHDVVAACSLALASENPDLLSGNPLNLASGSAISIRDLSIVLCRLAGRQLNTRDAPAREGDILHSCGDRSKALKLLHWSPQKDFETGIVELLR